MLKFENFNVKYDYIHDKTYDMFNKTDFSCYFIEFVISNFSRAFLLRASHSLLFFIFSWYVVNCRNCRGWCEIVLVSIETTAQSKERISIKDCCASLRDADSNIPHCRVSAFYSRPISLSFFFSIVHSICSSRAYRFNLFWFPLFFSARTFPTERVVSQCKKCTWLLGFISTVRVSGACHHHDL